MNDPNGLMYHNGTYHLYYQYNPGGNTWGAMSWGHATSSDLIHWEHQDVALLARGYPGEITEMYFSGSAVADTENTSGFGTDGKVPFIAMYTSFYPNTQTLPSGKTVEGGTQAQSIAYSLDEGMTWTTYDAGNPVIPLPPTPYEDQFKEYRDPFVFWHESTQKWVVVLALAKVHKAIVYTSENLKDWTYASEFGPMNAVGGVWECPGLYPLPLDGDNDTIKWVLQLGINPGGPPGTVGSGTQYFVGDFDGTTFVADGNPPPGNTSVTVDETNWMDLGPDFYAAATFNGLSMTDRYNIAWMSNWQYGASIPTDPWRSAMSIPRKISLKTINEKAILIQQPAEALASLESSDSYSKSWDSFPEGNEKLQLSGKTLDITLSFSNGNTNTSAALLAAQFGIILRATTDLAQETRVGYDFGTQKLFVNRTKSGEVGFDGTFANVYYAPLTTTSGGNVTMRILLDWSSIEVFGGEGEVTLSTQIFPDDSGTDILLFSTSGVTNGVTVTAKVLDSAFDGSVPSPSSSSIESTSTPTSTSNWNSTLPGMTTAPTTFATSVTASKALQTPRAITPARATTDFRPTFHFVPDKNWMNEPNGLIKIGSTWHLFFQHNPTGNFWGNMNWGHATSTDLVHWEHKPIAITNENGVEAFTGTAYYDAANSAGLGTSTNPPYLAFYTGWFPDTTVQDQRLAYSLDQGATWIKYEGNPIISQAQEAPHDATGGLETRDPKVFFYEPTGEWVMILCHGGQNKVSFWTSTDAKAWAWKSDFTSSDATGLPADVKGWEVPDFFQLPIEGTSQTTWVMLITPAVGSPAGGNGVFGFTGSFDGTSFTADPVDQSTMWLDYGRDFDGTLSWEAVPESDGRRIIAGVMNSYGGHPPTETWKGMLSFPRTLKLKQIDGKLRFLQQPVDELKAVSTSIEHVTNKTLTPTETLFSTIHATALDIRISYIPSAGSTLSLVVRKGGSEQTVIKYDQSNGQVSVDRNQSGNISYDAAAGGVHVATFSPDASGVVQLRVLVDECSLEVYGGEGQAVISNLIFPHASSDGLSLATLGGNAQLLSVEVLGISL
ncbi:hypothetical protein V496_07217 [Pseudogymnoascus sp. VKM F-4515 (FW-2607)]|nr:hypothetical protein V496_07217 [Pseudogymnoascus sp. VKM F-4515 (FW-2607)]KFY80267.1 hypothetical protein V498_08834 [Pseudogymnoascus sp. VKM F-4517 (FW-2822)]